MAEISIFQTRQDFEDLINFVINRFSLQIWIEKCFDGPIGLSFRTYNEIEDFLETNKNGQLASNSFLLTSDSWSIEPIYYTLIEPVDKKYKAFYSAISKYGGPSIELRPSFFGVIQKHVDKILCGSISDYPYYISGSFLNDRVNGYRTIDRPVSLQAAHTEIKKFLMKDGKKVKYNNGKFTRTAIAMKHAFHEYRNGTKLLMGDMEYKFEK